MHHVNFQSQFFSATTAVVIGAGSLLYIPLANATPAVPDKSKAGTAQNKRQPDVDFGPYMARLERKIGAAWTPPQGHEFDRITVIFQLNNSGDVSDLRVKGSSGFESSDKEALAAVTRSGPFEIPPKGAPKIIGVEFTFDFNIVKGIHKGDPDFVKRCSDHLSVSPIDSADIRGIRGIDFHQFMDDIEIRIKRAWFPPRGQESRQVLVSFKVSNKGEMTDPKIERSSGVALADTAALVALQTAAGNNFRYVPPDCPSIVNVHFLFDPDLLPKSDRRF